jgi:hypothetical protein
MGDVLRQHGRWRDRSGPPSGHRDSSTNQRAIPPCARRTKATTICAVCLNLRGRASQSRWCKHRISIGRDCTRRFAKRHLPPHPRRTITLAQCEERDTVILDGWKICPPWRSIACRTNDLAHTMNRWRLYPVGIRPPDSRWASRSARPTRPPEE